MLIRNKVKSYSTYTIQYMLSGITKPSWLQYWICDYACNFVQLQF